MCPSAAARCKGVVLDWETDEAREGEEGTRGDRHTPQQNTNNMRLIITVCARSLPSSKRDVKENER